MQVLSGLMYSTYSGIFRNEEVPGQESAQYSLQSWLFYIICVFLSWH